ncbi:hypothetical protein [Acetobacter sp. AAB5]|uniref:hypothetical protein n=1 Tax=Acetobacter sp. AAB5 TaxID=3418370 RepID=UPI003CF88397
MLTDRGEQVEAFDERGGAVFLGQQIPEATDCRRGQIGQRKLCDLVLKNGGDVTFAIIFSHT